MKTRQKGLGFRGKGSSRYYPTLSPIPYPLSPNTGLSLIELIVIGSILIIIAGTVTAFFDPVEFRQKARDARRISDLGVLAQAIEQYNADHANIPPDTDLTLRISSQSSGSASPADSHGSGWIPVDLSGYLEKLPVDPRNTNGFFYRYYRKGKAYKVDAKLEFYTAKMQNSQDGGNDNCHYEEGGNYKTITLVGGC